MNGFEQLLERARALVARRERHTDAFVTPEGVRLRQAELRERFRDMLGVQHMPRNERRARRTGSTSTGGITIEKWLLEPFDRYPITLLLYKPVGENRTDVTVPMNFRPCVLAPVGHYNEGKAAEPYQRLCSQLAGMGYIVACYDPIGQGERSFHQPDRDHPDYESIVNCVNQHSRLGMLGYLTGVNISMFFVYDAMCVMDFVTEQTGITEFICTGHSGGGTLTAYLAAIEDRITQAIPTHYITTFLQLLEHNRAAPGDHEQSLFGFLEVGFDMADYLWMAAPKPVLINAAERDFFPIAGTRETFRQASRIYGLLGANERLRMNVVPVEHALTKEVRERIYSYIAENEVREAEWPTYPVEVLHCSEQGDAWQDRNTALEQLKGMIGRNRGNPDNRDLRSELESTASASAIRDWLTESLRIGDPDAYTPAGEVIWSHRSGNDRLLIISDMDAVTEEWDLQAARDIGCSVLRVEPWERELTMLAGRERAPITYSEDMRLTLYAAVCGEQVMGIRLRQLLGAVGHALANFGRKPPQIVLFGSGPGGILANMAALFIPNVSKVVNAGTLSSFRQLFAGLDYEFAPSSAVHGMLTRFDLDDIAASHGLSKLDIVNPIGVEPDEHGTGYRIVEGSLMRTTEFMMSIIGGEDGK